MPPTLSPNAWPQFVGNTENEKGNKSEQFKLINGCDVAERWIEFQLGAIARCVLSYR